MRIHRGALFGLGLFVMHCGGSVGPSDQPDPCADCGDGSTVRVAGEIHVENRIRARTPLGDPAALGMVSAHFLASQTPEALDLLPTTPGCVDLRGASYRPYAVPIGSLGPESDAAHLFEVEREYLDLGPELEVSSSARVAGAHVLIQYAGSDDMIDGGRRHDLHYGPPSQFGGLDIDLVGGEGADTASVLTVALPASENGPAQALDLDLPDRPDWQFAETLTSTLSGFEVQSATTSITLDYAFPADAELDALSLFALVKGYREGTIYHYCAATPSAQGQFSIPLNIAADWPYRVEVTMGAVRTDVASWSGRPVALVRRASRSRFLERN